MLYLLLSIICRPAGGMVPQIAIPTGPVVAPVPPLQQISTPHNRPIQAVQPHQVSSDCVANI